jgi:hypothetical protein
MRSSLEDTWPRTSVNAEAVRAFQAFLDDGLTGSHLYYHLPVGSDRRQ